MVLAVAASLGRLLSVHQALTCREERSRSGVWRESLEQELERAEPPYLILSLTSGGRYYFLFINEEMEFQKG